MPSLPSNFEFESSGQYKPGHTGTILAQSRIERGMALNFYGQPHDGRLSPDVGQDQFLGLAMGNAGSYNALTGEFTPQMVAWCRTGSFTALCAQSFSPGDYVWSDAKGAAIKGTPERHYGMAYSYAQPGGLVEVLLGSSMTTYIRLTSIEASPTPSPKGQAQAEETSFPIVMDPA